MTMYTLKQQAIRTRFAGPTDRSPARWIVTAGGRRLVVPYDYAAGDAGEAQAAQALADALGWGQVTGGVTYGGCTYWATA